MTQTEAAEELGISRQRVGQIADEDRLKFRRRSAKKLRTCSKCSRELTTRICLRCKWTPAAIKALRRRIGITQDELAFKIGVGTATITRWESGQTPSPRGLQKLEEARLGLP